MPDGKYPYTEEGIAASKAAKKRKGKDNKGSFFNWLATVTPGDREKYAKGRTDADDKEQKFIKNIREQERGTHQEGLGKLLRGDVVLSALPKDEARQGEIDRGERFVGKKTGTIDTSKGKDKTKKLAQGVRRAGEYMQADEKLDDELWNQRTLLEDLEQRIVDVEGEESKRELQAAIDSIRRRTERPQRKLDRKYPTSAQHKKDVHRRKAESGE